MLCTAAVVMMQRSLSTAHAHDVVKHRPCAHTHIYVILYYIILYYIILYYIILYYIILYYIILYYIILYNCVYGNWMLMPALHSSLRLPCRSCGNWRAWYGWRRRAPRRTSAPWSLPSMRRCFYCGPWGLNILRRRCLSYRLQECRTPVRNLTDLWAGCAEPVDCQQQHPSVCCRPCDALSCRNVCHLVELGETLRNHPSAPQQLHRVSTLLETLVHCCEEACAQCAGRA